MASTPESRCTAHKSPPKTMGWSNALFGMFSSKKPSNVDSSTDSTPNVGPSRTRVRPSPGPLVNLEGYAGFRSPEQQPQQNHTAQKKIPEENVSTIENAAASSSKPPPKSPWKSSPTTASFSVGNLRPSDRGHSNVRPYNGRTGGPSFSSTTRVAPVRRVSRRPRSYKPSSLLQVSRKTNKNASAPPPNLKALLSNARSAFRASAKKIESDKNFRAAPRIIGRGRRLVPPEHRGRTGRLPQDRPTTQVFAGKRKMERQEDPESTEDDSNEVITRFTKRNVKFGSDLKTSSAPTPFESFVAPTMATPAKSINTARKAKRKATPFSKGGPIIELETEEEDTKMTPSSRKLVKVNRRNASATTTSTDDKKSITFDPMPDENFVIDWKTTSWSSSSKQEPVSMLEMGTRRVDPWYGGGDLADLKRADVPSDIPEIESLPQFKQKPLFVGKKKDRRVDFDKDDSEDVDVVDNKLKKGKTDSANDQWECSKCGFKNNNDETYCVNMVAGANHEKKRCNNTRSTRITIGWGDTFAYMKDKIKCKVCNSFNDKGTKVCKSCEAPLGDIDGNTDNKSAPASSSGSMPANGSIGAGGFSFGGTISASSTASSTSKFKFGAPATSASASPSAAGGFKFTAPAVASSASSSGGFKFGSSTSTPATTSASTTSDFKFGGSSKEPAASTSGTNGGFKFGASSSSPATKSLTSSTSSAAPAASKPTFSFGVSSVTKDSLEPATGSPTAPKFSFGKSSDTNTVAKPNEEATKDEPSNPSTKKSAAAVSFGGSTSTDSTPATASGFSFGNTSAPALTSTSASTTGFSFGSSGSETAPRALETAPKFSFGTNTNSSGASSGATPAAPLGSIKTTEEDEDVVSKKKRRNEGDSTSASVSSSKPTFSFGSKSTSDTPAAAAPLFGSKPTSEAPSTTAPTFSFGKSSKDSTANTQGASSSNGAPAFGTSSTTPAPLFGSSSSAAAPATSNFGSTPAASAPAASTFGSTPAAPAPAASTFGSTPAAPAPAASTFGSTPAAPAPAASTFGSTPAAPTSAAPTFGSVPSAPAPSAPFTFGSSSAAPAPAAPSFGSSTPAPSAPSFGTSAPAPAGLSFGTATPAAPAPAPFTFGSSSAAPKPANPPFGAATPAPSAGAPSFSFGAAPAAGPATFGSTPAAPSSSMDFGSSTPTAPTFGSNPSGAAPAQFGAPAPMSFGSTTPTPAFGSTPSDPAQPFGNTPTTFSSAQPSAGSGPMGFGGAPAPAAMGGFGGGGFGQTPQQQQQQQPQQQGGFSLGTGGASRGASRGRRRILKARRPR